MISLPTLRLSYLRTWPGLASVSRGLGQRLLGKVLWLPAALGREELDELVDTLVLLLDLPVAITPDPSRSQTSETAGALVLVPSPVPQPPAALRHGVVVCTRERVPGHWCLDLPHEVLIIRDAVIECIGRQLSASGLARIASWVAGVADTPATAIRFVDGVQTHLLKHPEAQDSALYCAGLAAVLDWLLTGVDVRVAQWLLTLGFGGPGAERRLGTDATLLGQQEALRRAFERGLLHQVPRHEGDPLDLRRPLEALGRLDSAPGRPTQEQLVEHLGQHLSPSMRQVLERLVQPTALRLGLPGPAEVPLIGREEIVKRLTALLEPADQIRTCVLYGVVGSGKTPVAASVAHLLEHRLETVWINFTGGPLAGWLRVAVALGLDTQKPAAERRDRAGVPRWVREAQRRLATGTYLLVVDEVEEVQEELLPEWLPTGPGSCAVLVLSRSPQRALQRAHDAIAIHMPLFSLEDARHFMQLRTPALSAEIARGEADSLMERVGRHPGALTLLAHALEQRGLPSTLEALSAPAQEVDVIPRVVQEVVASLGEDEQTLLRALWLCAPGGTRIELVREICELQDVLSTVEWLVDRGLLVQSGRTIRLEVLVRLCLDRLYSEAQDSLLLTRHASGVVELIEKATQRRDSVMQGELHEDLFLASKRMVGLVEQGHEAAVGLCYETGSALRDFPLGGQDRNLRQALSALRCVLGVWTREAVPDRWALAQNSLGIAFSYLQSGNREENLQQAISAYRAALEVWTRQSDPERWATAHNNLGNAFSELPKGRREENLQQAISAYHSALEVWTRDSGPERWALVQNNLGNAFSELPTGRREENLRQAISAYRAALEVWTRQAHPEQWATTHNNLGTAFTRLPTGNRGSNLRLAIASYHSALEVWTHEAFPEKWALVHVNLGITFSRLPTGKRQANLRQALAEFSAALEVVTQESSPESWAILHHHLGAVLRELSSSASSEG
jgi:tetratricopeptide (TPR) repeat protein